ncbi:hypothetical protein D3C85_1660880 [compost metagenome]
MARHEVTSHNLEDKAMTNRRLMQGLTTVDMSAGYARFVEPNFVIEQYYMLGDHGAYCPIQFR